jgi:CRP-like cAMP-binding protein
MQPRSDFGESTQSTFDQPKYLPLQGELAEQTSDLLVRKGSLLTPAVSRAEAEGIMRFMNLEHFKPGSIISFNAQSDETGRLMLVLVGEANIRMRNSESKQSASDYSPLGQVQSKWFNVSEGSTLGLVHAFSGLSSRFLAQAVTDLFVASLTRIAFQQMKRREPVLALRFLEITAIELALVAIGHEKNLIAMSNVARSMQDHIGFESGLTAPAPLSASGSF